MTHSIKLSLLFALVFGLSLSVFGQKPDPVKDDANKASEATQTKAPTSADYDALLAKLKGGDTSIDFGKLRMAFTATKMYSYSGSDDDERNKMLKLLADKDYKKALKTAEKMLDDDYVNANAHYVAFISNKELKNNEKAEFHKAVLFGLLNSVKGSNDGFSAKSPFYVITIEEEYAVIRFLGYRFVSQSLQHLDGHTFDVFDVTDAKSGQKTKLYFNIDPIWKAETEVFRK